MNIAESGRGKEGGATQNLVIISRTPATMSAEPPGGSFVCATMDDNCLAKLKEPSVAKYCDVCSAKT